MGGCLSCRSLPASFDVIRLVHFNGSVHDFDDPITVSDIAGKPPKYFVCTPEQLMSFSSSESLLPDTQLERGRIYYVLPISALQWEASPIDFVCMATRLNKVAERCGSKSKSKSKSKSNHVRNPQSSPVLDPSQTMRGNMSTRERLNPISEQVRSAEQESVAHEKMKRDKMCPRAISWKPILQTINERSFSRRSESDLQIPR